MPRSFNHSTEKKPPFQQLVLGHGTFTHDGTKLSPCFTAYTETTQVGEKTLNTRGEAIKLLEENTGEILHDIRFDNGSVDVTPKHRQKEKKIEFHQN